MDIIFGSSKLRKDCCDDKRARGRWGPRQAKLIRQRLDELRAAEVLEQIRHLPQARCHELRGARAGQLSVDVVHPYRLVFEVVGPVPRKPDRGLDWTGVKQVRILEVGDTHE